MSQPPESSVPRRPWALGVAAVVVAVMLGMISHGHFGGSGDAVHYMVIARSLVLDHDLDLANDYSDPHSLILNGRLQPEAHARPGRDGRLRPVHDLGWPFLSAPAFAVAHALAERVEALPEGLRRRARLDRWIALRQLLSAAVILVSAVLAVVLCGLMRSLGHPPRDAALGSLFVVLTAPLLTLGYVYMTEVPTALLALWLLARVRRGLGPERWRSAALGLAVGALVLVHARNVGLALGLAVLAFNGLPGSAARASFSAGLVLAAALRTAINFGFWGTWITNPHAQLGTFVGLGPMLSESLIRLLGLLFDQRHGLVPQAPAALLAPAGWLVLRRREPRLGGWLLWVGGAYLAFVLCPLSNIHGWRGGFSPAARFLVPMAPLVGLLVVEAARSSRRGLWLASPLVAIQAVSAAGFWSQPMVSWAEGPGPAPWLEAWSLAPLAPLLPGWDPATPAAIPATAALLAVAGGLAFVIPRHAR